MGLQTWPIEDAVKIEEGFRARPYECPEGKKTVGYGFNIDGWNWEMPKPVADLWARLIVKKAEDLLLDYFGPAVWVCMGCARQAALVSMVYQLGWTGFLMFTKMNRAIRVQNWTLAHDECLASKAARQTPDRYARNARALYTGEWQWGYGS